MGTILSANPKSAYFYEPYHHNLFKHPNGTRVNLHFDQVDEDFISGYTNDIFDCKHVRSCTSFLFNGFLKDIKAKSEVAMFAIYLLSERSERKVYMAYMATKGLPLYPEKSISYELLKHSLTFVH